MMRRIAIAGWIGSDNLRNELILRALARCIRAPGAMVRSAENDRALVELIP